jgi:hypothetical protein
VTFDTRRRMRLSVLPIVIGQSPRPPVPIVATSSSIQQSDIDDGKCSSAQKSGTPDS